MDTEPKYYEVDPDGDIVLNLQNNDTAKESPASDQGQSEPEVSPAKEHSNTIACMLLSSKHLTLASLYFRNMFKGNWLEGRQPENNGKIQIYEEGSELQPLLILMSIIHGRSTQIPRTVDLPMLTNIATLVDYYKCTEAVEIVAELWISRLESHVPKISSEALQKSQANLLLQWVWIAYTFNKPQLFASITKQLIERSPVPLSVVNYPIPDNIISSLNQKRQSSITGVIKTLGTVNKRLRQQKIGCHHNCRCMLIGIISIRMETLNTTPGDLARLPPRLSFRELADYLLSITLTPCGSFNLKKIITAPVENAEKKLRGLKLSDFRSSES